MSAVRIGKKKGSDELIVNPSYAFRNADDTELDLLVCGKDGAITMIEVGAKEVPEAILETAFAKALEVIAGVQKIQSEVIAAVGKQKQEFPAPKTNPALDEIMNGMSAAVRHRSIFERARQRHDRRVHDRIQCGGYGESTRGDKRNAAVLGREDRSLDG